MVASAGRRPRPWVGVAAVAGSVAVCTVAIYPLAQTAPNQRRKVEPAGVPRCIRTDPGVGDRFAA